MGGRGDGDGCMRGDRILELKPVAAYQPSSNFWRQLKTARITQKGKKTGQAPASGCQRSLEFQLHFHEPWSVKELEKEKAYAFQTSDALHVCAHFTHIRLFCTDL